MTSEKIEHHYRQSGGLLQKIESALALIGKTEEYLSVDDISAIDEFHTGGRLATKNLVSSLDVKPNQHVLDVGCGIGGTARYLVSEFKCRVTGIDLTAEFVETGKRLCEKTCLSDNINLVVANALETGLDSGSFDAACMLHVGMNIEDKQRLFEEISRLLKPAGKIALYDVMLCKNEPLRYPVPWATSAETSFPQTPAEYIAALERAGFVIEHELDRSGFALEFMAKIKKRQETSQEPAAPGLQLLMGSDAALKVKNMVMMMQEGLLAPVEIIAQKAE